MVVFAVGGAVCWNIWWKVRRFHLRDLSGRAAVHRVVALPMAVHFTATAW